ncbi:acyl-CoA synthetase [Bordetella pseudohinzii]|uniref:Acetate--CoA ligase n=1 Tax=Bordetella pseudohinzii TaxID=1331258 RepID=A0A0J6BU89_9BORD|nr:acyl-CoA synthetase [Bordetella pseudohinzii]ANY16126.1 acetate--CoA ligase [Bordetella pseudohinzii]KMM25389.1 acetate--CoA ligase [Bordetella pseudohinzii]KXA76568.1 acetate--CoA ligase [Bordetella pseudohinzii]KXA81277.1 acetate--CoA ligase [Bordetella pseudohinzii]CUJ03595.1 Acetyl-coenzyme A synthetase [Bordetella pseudohinzii]
MTQLTDYLSYADAQAYCSPEKLWALFDGDSERMNIAHECIDRHAASGRPAVILVRANGQDELIGYDELARDSSRFAHALAARGVAPGDRVAVMLEPSREFYVALFGAIKMGAIAVPLFTLFGPDGIRLRIEDCRPRLLITNAEKAPLVPALPGLDVEVADEGFLPSLAGYPAQYTAATRADDLAIFQYTSGTTRELPEAVRHSHRAIVTLMMAALYGSGLRPGDRFMCPSSPAWGHGLWHGTLAPLALGITIGAYAGKYQAERLLQALQIHRFNNLSAAATHYRMMRNSGAAGRYRYCLDKLSFTGEPIDSETADFVTATFGRPACSMYGTTEIGVCLVNYPGAPDFTIKSGSLGKPVPGLRVQVQDAEGRPCPPGVTGEIKLWRRGAWVATKDLGRVDADGYFWHGGRADDVIISAGWTMSAVEIEDAILKHPDVTEAAAIGVPDALRGQVVKAYVVARRPGSETFIQEIQDLVRGQLSQHEYPRQVAFVAELPKTPAGKIHRKKLREAALPA